ncbi:MAG: aldehyde dehydrogenase family protein, partial [Terriglobia bacterium]
MASTAGILESEGLREIPLYINGGWSRSKASERFDVVNPATGDAIARVPASGYEDVDAAVKAAAAAFPGWRQTPPEDRIQYLFHLKNLLEEHFDDLARIISTENGKTLSESRGEIRRAIENVEVACGIPTMMQGYHLEDIARGIDETMVRQPVGVTAAITPFNFPVMIPFWFLPYAIACGNTFILKPSEKVPLSAQRTFELLDELKLPPGVVNLVYGAKPAVDALLEHPGVHAISFVGSTPVAKYIYAQASAHGKRVQCQGGAKNHVLVLPDADMDSATRITAESAFGCAGQRCLAVSVVITAGEAEPVFKKRILEAAASVRVGDGLDEQVQMGPVITPESKARITDLVSRGASGGANILLDGRN